MVKALEVMVETAEGTRIQLPPRRMVSAEERVAEMRSCTKC